MFEEYDSTEFVALLIGGAAAIAVLGMFWSFDLYYGIATSDFLAHGIEVICAIGIWAMMLHARLIFEDACIIEEENY